MSHFDYNPKDAANILPAGEYEATIEEYVDKDKEGKPLVSTKGEEMIYVVFKVYGEREVSLRCYFTVKGGLWRYRELAGALGKAQDFTDKKFSAANYIGSGITVVLSEKDDAKYGPQNNIDEFKPLVRASSGTTVTTEDIPF